MTLAVLSFQKAWGGRVFLGTKSTVTRRVIVLTFILVMTMMGCERRPNCESVNATATAAVDARGARDGLTPEQATERWKQGRHAQSYVEGDTYGNTSCARCHAPHNWHPLHGERPKSWELLGLQGLETPILIPEESWSGVTCAVCHTTGSDLLPGDIAWLEVPPLGIYETVSSPTDLCTQCHLADVDREHVSLTFSGVHAALTCIDCHDAHDGAASCGNMICHAPFAQECVEIETHDKPHSEVTCSGCHDGLGLPIGWNEVAGRWDTFLGGDPGTDRLARPFTSHTLVLEVDCDRCHAPGDHPWDPQ